jgi:hypothetical protein
VIAESRRSSNLWAHLHYGMPAPHISARVLDDQARRNTSNRQAMLYYTQWCPDSGEGLDYGDVQRARRLAGPTLWRNDDHVAVVVGLDGSVSRDHTGAVALGVNVATGTIDVLSVKSWKPSPETGDVDFGEVERFLLDAHRRYDGINLVYDPPQLEYVAQRLRLHGVPCLPWYSTAKNLNAMADALLSVFRNGLIRTFADLPDEPLEVDLRRLTIEQKAYGQKLEARRDRATGHADRGFALATALPIALGVLYDEQGRDEQPEWGRVSA